MATRKQKVTPFQAGANSDDHEKGSSVEVKSNMSKVKDSGDHGALYASLGHRGQTLPSDNHVWTQTTTVMPAGAYKPEGEFGSVKRQGKGRGVYSYGGAPNKKGENALGKAMNRVGQKSGYPKGKRK